MKKIQCFIFFAGTVTGMVENHVFLSLSHSPLWQNWMWPGPTAVVKSIRDTGTGLQTHKHHHHCLQPSSESRDHRDDGEHAQMINLNVFFTLCTFLYDMWPGIFLAGKMLYYRLN